MPKPIYANSESCGSTQLPSLPVFGLELKILDRFFNFWRELITKDSNILVKSEKPKLAMFRVGSKRNLGPLNYVNDRLDGGFFERKGVFFQLSGFKLSKQQIVLMSE